MPLLSLPLTYRQPKRVAVKRSEYYPCQKKLFYMIGWYKPTYNVNKSQGLSLILLSLQKRGGGKNLKTSTYIYICPYSHL